MDDMLWYEIVNMFADHAFAGSPLGVVLDADSLPAAAMQAIAREINTPETAFVLSPSAASATYRVRIFTPTGESPFGSHSVLGTAVTLARLGVIAEGAIVQECGTRQLSVSVSSREGTITCRDPIDSRDVDAGYLWDAASLAGADLADVPRAAGFGPLFNYLPVRPGAERRAVINLAQMRARELSDVTVFSWNPSTRVAHARVFAPGYGIPEDPACASIALGLGVWLVETGWLPRSDGAHGYEIRQGAGSARVGRLTCAVTVENGRVSSASVTGRVIPVARGQIAASLYAA